MCEIPQEITHITISLNAMQLVQTPPLCITHLGPIRNLRTNLGRKIIDKVSSYRQCEDILKGRGHTNPSLLIGLTTRTDKFLLILLRMSLWKRPLARLATLHKKNLSVWTDENRAKYLWGLLNHTHFREFVENSVGMFGGGTASIFWRQPKNAVSLASTIFPP